MAVAMEPSNRWQVRLCLGSSILNCTWLGSDGASGSGEDKTLSTSSDLDLTLTRFCAFAIRPPNSKSRPASRQQNLHVAIAGCQFVLTSIARQGLKHVATLPVPGP